MSSEVTGEEQFSSSLQSSRSEFGELELKKGYRGIVCLNSSSYMAGIRKAWETDSVAVLRLAPKRFK